MSFLLYFVVLLVCAGSVVFGLDWMNSPLPPVRHKPATHVAKIEPQIRPVRKADLGDGAGDPKAKLTPIYPARPGGPPAAPASANAGVELEVASDADQKTANAARTAPAAPVSTAGAALPPEDQQANNSQANAAAAQATATAAAPTQCAVGACAATYRSFRASDCTYQPFSGPRRRCTSPATSHEQIATRQPTHAGADLAEATREVKRLTARDGGDDSRPVSIRRSVRPEPFDFFNQSRDDDQ